MSERALLQIDIVDSTKLGESLGDSAMSALWAAHDQVARSLLAECNGREIDKSDGFLLMFTQPVDAVRYAIAYHQRIAGLGHPMKARAGLHFGAIVMRYNAPEDVSRGAKPLELDGVAKAISARVMAVAAPGQLLLTAPAREALGGTEFATRSHGHWRLKGVEEPIELFHVDDESLPLVEPVESEKALRVVRVGEVWTPWKDIPHSLPAERDSFIGRSNFLKLLSARFAGGARLLCVLGTGGTGKTRLATRFGWSCLGSFPGGVYFCDLSQAASVDGIAHAVAQGMGISLEAADSLAQIGDAILGRKRCLLIIDNFEQVVSHAEDTLGRWLARAPSACFLVTSREVLGISGEQAVQLPPLQDEEARTLFMQRARAARSDFEAGQEDHRAANSLVTLLDGLPLAIELAAARVRLLSPRELLARMGQRFKILSSSGASLDRHATLRNTLDWSWNLLTRAERSMLAQLSLFDGGFTIGAVEAVVDVSAFDGSAWIVDVLQSLVEKSLVRQVGGHRFDLLMSIREYALERFDDPEVWRDSRAPRHACARHWNFYASLDLSVASANPAVELPNLVTACRRAAACDDGTAATMTLEACWEVLRTCGPFGVAVDLADVIAQVHSLSEVHLARVEWIAASALFTAGRGADAGQRLENSLRLARMVGNRKLEANVTCLKGELLTTIGSLVEARDCLDRSLALAKEQSDELLQCRIGNALGALFLDQSKTREARIHYQTALEISRAIGNKRWEGGLLGNLGSVDYADGHFDEAMLCWEEALSIARELGDRLWEGNTRCNLGLLNHERGHSIEAARELKAALEISQQIGHPRLESTSLCNLGIIFECEGDLQQSLACYESATRIAHRLGDLHGEGQFLGYLGLVLGKLGRASGARLAFDRSERLLNSDRVHLALTICKRCEYELLAGDIEGATVSLRRARAIRSELSIPGSAHLEPKLLSLSARLGATAD